MYPASPPTIDHPATSLGLRCAIATRPSANFSKEPKSDLTRRGFPSFQISIQAIMEGVSAIDPTANKPMSRRSRPLRGASLVTAKQAAERNRSLGFGPGYKPRGFGFDPPSDKANPGYTHSERVHDATTLFITQCVRAYMKNALTAAHPAQTKILASKIQGAGGNIKWLSSDADRRRAFYYEYCRLVGQHVPYDRVWQDDKADRQGEHHREYRDAIENIPRKPARRPPFRNRALKKRRKSAIAIAP
jgi:hypothetical protein